MQTVLGGAATLLKGCADRISGLTLVVSFGVPPG